MKAILMVALFAMLTASLPVKAEQSGIEGNIGVYSQYIWRGSQESANTVVSGEAEAELGAGFVASVEFVSPTGNTPQGGNITEIDAGLTYILPVGEAELKLGYLHSAFINHAAGNTGEVVLAMDYAPVAITYYNAILGNADGWKKDQYVDLELYTSLNEVNLIANFGFYIPSTDAANPTKFASTKNELGHIDLTVSKDLNISDLIIIPSARLSIPTYTGKPSNANQLVFAVAIGF